MSEAVRRKPSSLRPLDGARLSEMALAYVARFATSRAKLIAYLDRKLRERGIAEGEEVDIVAIADGLVALGYVDDAAFAGMKARSLLSRGYGNRRVDAALRAAGIDEPTRDDARADADAAWAAAIAFARRRRFGPFAGEQVTDPRLRDRQFAAMLRAGHDARWVRCLLRLAPNAEISETAPD